METISTIKWSFLDQVALQTPGMLAPPNIFLHDGTKYHDPSSNGSPVVYRLIIQTSKKGKKSGITLPEKKNQNQRTTGPYKEV